MLIKGNVTKMNRQPTEQEQIFAKLPHKGFVFKIYKELNSTKIKIPMNIKMGKYLNRYFPEEDI